MRGLTAVRSIAGTLLAVLLSGASLSVGLEPHTFAESLGIMAILGTPGYLILGVRLARFVDRQEEAGWKSRAAVVLRGMGFGIVNLLAIMLVLGPFIGGYILVLMVLLLVPLVVGGAGLGIGCLIGSERRIPGGDP
jgi:hypothetical protein